MLLCENKALAASWVNVCEAEKRGLHLSQRSPKVDPYGQQMDMLPSIPIVKKNNQNKCLRSGTEAFDQQHIFGFRVGLLLDPKTHMESHLYKHGRGGMCEQCNKIILFSKTWGGLGSRVVYVVKRLSMVVVLN